MSRKSSVVARRAWNILRLALLWARKGGLFRNRLMLNLNVYVRKLLHSNEARGALAYGDREFSFDDTPIFHVKMHRRSSSLRFKLPHIPCIKPHVVDFEYDFDYDDHEDHVTNDQDEMSEDEETNESCCDDQGIDLKAEEFIARFYEQMKLQRQVSYLQYN
ncbi:hypothetical protein Salat_2220600 [Sesamum alatum]|uniref:Cotton fiber protein n=1 Tax=Sesamum alatum TaxID=300844 RepID=A0AAE1XUZ1_9LAMI|nr:hypothetical protein Salat_2220600 [Sesamum alatum]